ncbi:hypothetical protein D3C76_1117810 [compost metagenome]
MIEAWYAGDWNKAEMVVRPVSMATIMNEVEGREMAKASVTTSPQLIRSVISMRVRRLTLSAKVPPIDPSKELSNKLIIVMMAIILALPVVCSTHKLKAIL